MSKVLILDLRPTQFAVGMREVETKIDKLRRFGSAEIHDYLHEHRIPVVVSPGGEHHLIDHHHLVRAAWEFGIQELSVSITADLSGLSERKFWEEMLAKKWLYLHDQFGKGPHAPELLPMDVRGLADDPFRSLAWAVREKKGFHKSEIPFCEFRWSEFFRKHISGHSMRSGFHQALNEALNLCHLPEAKALPGYYNDGKD